MKPPLVPDALNRIADTVLAYRPKAKQKAPRKRKSRAKKATHKPRELKKMTERPTKADGD